MINQMTFQIKWLLKNKEVNQSKGQTLIEYGLIVILIAIAVLFVLGLVGGQVQTLYQAIIDALVGAS